MIDVRTFSLLIAALLLTSCGKQEAPAPVQESSPAPAPTASATQANIHEFKIGQFAAFALKDGTLSFPNDNKTVAINRTREDVAKLLQAAGAPTAELELSIQPLLVRAADKVLLFDTGAGVNMGEGGGQLVATMREANLDPASVTDIFISHSHGDHVGGLIDASGALTFPNATVHISAPEWEHVKGKNAEANKALINALTPKVNAFTPASDLVPGVVKAVEVRGHTPGHSAYLISSDSDSLLYIGDTAHHYVVSVREPQWTIAFDTDAPTAESSRKDLIERSAASNQRIYAVHFPFPGLGKFVREGEQFVWAPED